LREVVRDYFIHKAGNYTEQTRRDFLASLENHVLPVLGSKPYEAITRRAALRDTIALTKGKHAAHAALKNLNTVWSKFYRDHASDNYTWPKVRSPLEAQDRSGNGRLFSDREIGRYGKRRSSCDPMSGPTSGSCS
jgi:hypothetical protein